MSNSRGGRRIEIIVNEYCYPHSDSAKKKGIGQVFPVIKTGYHRPGQAFHLLLEKSLEKEITSLSVQQGILAWLWLADKNRHDKVKTNDGKK